MLTARLQNIGHQPAVRVFCIKEPLNGAQLFTDMTRILLFHSVDEVLEIIAVPFTTETLHDLNPVTGIPFLVFGELIITALALTKKMSTDKLLVLVVYMDLPDGSLVLQLAVCVLPWYGVVAGFVQHISCPLTFVILEAVW